MPETELDRAFIVEFFTDLKDLKKPILRLGITTRRLLQFGSDEDIKMINQDTTYKVVYERFPCFIIGFSDKARVFHPIIVGISTNETQEDFRTFLEAWKRHRPGLAPQYSMSDAAAAIGNAASAAFPNIVRCMCFVHVDQNISKFLGAIKDKELRDAFKTDELCLAVAWSDACFDKVVELFLNKWKAVPQMRATAQYVQTEWITDRLRRFYRGAADGHPMNNCGLEATNHHFKKSVTGFHALAFMDFIHNTFAWTEGQSSRRDPTSGDAEYIRVRTQPVYERKDYEPAFNFACDNTRKIYSIPAEGIWVSLSQQSTGDFTNAIGMQLIQKYRECSFLSYDDYVSFVTHVRIITRNPNANNQECMSCICHDHAKHFTCRHSLGMAARMREIIIEDQYKNLIFTKKRGPGRPASQKGAWKRGTFDCLQRLDVNGTNNGEGIVEGVDVDADT